MSATERVPDVLVERLALGELPPEQAADVRRRLEAEDGGVERLAHIAASDEDVLAAHPPRRAADAIRDRADRRRAERKARSPSWFAVPALAGAAVVAVVIAIGLPGGVPDEGADRTKGDAILVLHRKAGAGTEVLRDGAAARAGDVLQIEINGGGAASGAVVSIDGRGEVTLHFPERPDAPTTLPAGPFALPRAYELDDAPAFERFVFVTSGGPIDAAAVVAAARAVGADRTRPLALPAGATQVSETIVKEGPR